MLTIFNQKELVRTYNMKQQAELRDILAQNHIDYTVKVVNRKSPSPFDAGSRARTGTFGESLQMENEYIVYVYKNDYEKAAELLRS